MKKIFCFVAFCMLFCAGTALAAPESNPIVRVGLYYNAEAIPTANLQVINGSGYRFGFFDSGKSFVSLWSASISKITMAKDRNLYFSAGKFYESGAPAGSKVLGAYHIETTTQYPNAASALAAVNSLKASGHQAFGAYINGAFRVRIGSFASIEAAGALRAKIGGGVVGNSNTCVTVYNTETGETLFEYDGGTFSTLAVYPSQGEVAMPLTWFKGYKYYGGFEYIRNGNNLTVINYVPMQEYVKGVVPYEMSPTWPSEALRAQAMCARTYAYSSYGKHGSAFDICGSTHCQVYHGANAATANSDRAVDETMGKYILYNGQPINAVFHSSDGGATEDSENVWGSAIPYLRGVVDPHEDLNSAINGRWSYEYTPQDITTILNTKGYSAALIADVYTEQTKMGNVLTLTFIDVNGKRWTFSKERARSILNSSSLKKYTHSQRFTIRRAGSVPSASSQMNVVGGGTVNPSSGSVAVIGKGGAIDTLPPNGAIVIQSATGKAVLNGSGTSSGNGNFIVSGTGWGHNMGLSQNGAKAMANKGFTAEEIICFYYTGVTITQ